MYQYKNSEDTITAISTPSGVGGIGIIRLSGQDAESISDKIFKSRSGKKLKEFKSHTLHYGWIIDLKSEVVDEVLLSLMRAPKSYTKETVVEISCHGGIVSLKAILNLVIESGARLAEPGEFTKRAFLNGRIDLAQAEAVLDIIQSKTDAFLHVSTNQLKGDLSRTLETIREDLMSTYVEIEAIVNFPEDEIDAKGRERIAKDIEKSNNKVEELLQSSESGRILKEGMNICLCGRPNVGKSSLLNCLLKTPRAIVSEVAGTTRDTIEEAAQIKGIPFQLIDTAGILEPRDTIEEEAIKRSHMHIEGADLVLLVVDSSEELNDEDVKLIEKVKDFNVLVVLNKSDLDLKVNTEQLDNLLTDRLKINVSAAQKDGIEKLEDKIVECVLQDKKINHHVPLISNIRHIQSLKDARLSLQKAQTTILEGISLEFVSEEIKVGVNFLDGITGKNIDQDLLDTIFSQFCIGK